MNLGAFQLRLNRNLVENFRLEVIYRRAGRRARGRQRTAGEGCRRRALVF